MTTFSFQDYAQIMEAMKAHGLTGYSLLVQNDAIFIEIRKPAIPSSVMEFFVLNYIFKLIAVVDDGKVVFRFSIDKKR